MPGSRGSVRQRPRGGAAARRWWRRAAALASTLALSAVAAGCGGGEGGDAAAGGEGGARSAAPTRLIVLGDSLGRGVQPDPQRTLKGGYGPALRERIAAGADGAVELVEAACGGATSASFIAGGQPCLPDAPIPYANRDRPTAQLAWATGTLAQASGAPTVVTLTIGGNDAVACWESEATAAALGRCLREGLPQLRRRWARIARELRRAAGPRTVLAVATLYDPALAALRSGDRGLEARARVFHRFLTARFNPAIRELFGEHDWVVADLAARVGEREPIDGPAARPVQRVCELTWACENGDIHPNDAGYRELAGAFGDAVEPRLARAAGS